MQNLTVYIIVLAWNQLKETVECLEALAKSEFVADKIIVVDNGSTDDTPTTILQDFPDVALIRSEENLGVSGGYNLGMDYAVKQGADYVLILNNDVVMEPQTKMEFRTVYIKKDAEKGAFLGSSLQEFGGRGWRMVSVTPNPDDRNQMIVFMQRQAAVRLDTSPRE